MENVLDQKLTEEVLKFRRAKTPIGLSNFDFVLPLSEQKILVVNKSPIAELR